jgi:penicillin V acylase-like amidase (Ntn superfamily)
MSIKRTICGIEWRVYSPSLYVFDSYDDADDSIAVFYRDGWHIADRTTTVATNYPTRDMAMDSLARALQSRMLA